MAKKPQTPSAAAPDPVTEAKQRLRTLAVSRKLLRRSGPAAAAPLAPSPALAKLDGRDIVKRGQRKSRYLFSFPGLLAPLSAGRVGELADLASPNPLLYLEFPQGRLKLFGTHIYPKNKYLALQLTKSAKGVLCEDSFDSLIVFSDAWWIGLKEENPEELKLDFPKEFIEGKSAECDFKGGAGGASDEAAGGNISGKEYIEPGGNISGKEYIEPLSPESDDMLVESNLTNKEDTKNLLEATPVRQSARTAGKTLSYVDPDSGDDPIGDDAIASDPESSEATDEKVDTRNGNAARRSIFGKTEDSTPATSSLVASEPAFTEAAGNLSTGKVELDPLSPKKVERESSRSARTGSSYCIFFI